MDDRGLRDVYGNGAGAGAGAQGRGQGQVRVRRGVGTDASAGTAAGGRICVPVRNEKPPRQGGGFFLIRRSQAIGSVTASAQITAYT